MKRILAIFLMCAAMAWGTVTTTSNTVTYSCNGSTQGFAFTFPISGTDTSQIDVILRTVATGAEETLTETTDYTIAATNNDYASGGTVTTVATYTDAYALSIVRVTPVTQTADLSSRSSVSYASLEAYFDKLVMIAQDLTQKLALTLTAPSSDSGTSYEIPEAAIRATKYLAFDSLGDPIATAGTTHDPAISVYGDTLVGAADAAAARALLGLDTTDDVEFAGITGTTGTFSGLITANSGVTLGAGDDLIGSATSDITINTNKFTVAGATGNTVIAGSLGVTGVATLGDGSLLAAATEAADTDRTIVDKGYVEDGTTVSYDAEGGYSNCDVDATNTKVYTKYLTGTTDADTQTNVAHGVTDGYNKIIAVSAAVGDGTNMTMYDYYLAESAAAGHRAYWTATNVILNNVVAAKQSQRYVIRIDYIL